MRAADCKTGGKAQRDFSTNSKRQEFLPLFYRM